MAETPSANYDGIPGTVYCLGTDCKVDSNGKLAGSWYFTPASTTLYYRKVGTDTNYTAETAYAQFGHWLTTGVAASTSGPSRAPVSGKQLARRATNITGLAVGVNELLDKSATYEGTAAGMSLHKEVDGDGGVVPGTLQSGAFTADVTLTATFGASPLLGGYINGFKGNAVDPDWRVTLVEGAFNGRHAGRHDDGLRSGRRVVGDRLWRKR